MNPDKRRKITVTVSKDDLAMARGYTGQGITATLLQGLRTLVADAERERPEFKKRSTPSSSGTSFRY
jgi:hypothetical protein